MGQNLVKISPWPNLVTGRYAAMLPLVKFSIKNFAALLRTRFNGREYTLSTSTFHVSPKSVNITAHSRADTHRKEKQFPTTKLFTSLISFKWALVLFVLVSGYVC